MDPRFWILDFGFWIEADRACDFKRTAVPVSTAQSKIQNLKSKIRQWLPMPAGTQPGVRRLLKPPPCRAKPDTFDRDRFGRESSCSARSPQPESSTSSHLDRRLCKPRNSVQRCSLRRLEVSRC